MRSGGVILLFHIRPLILKSAISQQFEPTLVSGAHQPPELRTEELLDATPTAIKSVIEFLNTEKADALLKGRYIYVKYDATMLPIQTTDQSVFGSL